MGKTSIDAPAGSQSIDVTREFAAPPELVFRAYSDPVLLTRWLGGPRLEMTVDTWEPRHGGRWRYIHRGAGGEEYIFRGVFHGDLTIDGITQTWEYEGWPGAVSLETVTFVPGPANSTRLQIHTTYPSVEARDQMIGSGMEEGMNDGFARLDELLAEMTSV